jgi:hypothetical protein
MARIPLMNTQASAPSVPDLAQGPSIAKAGQAWDAVARVGAIASDIGNDLLAKRKEAEIKSYTVSSKADIDRRVTEYQSQLDAEFQGKDPTGYSSKMNEFLNDIGTEILDNAPSEDARTHFSTVFSEISNNIGMNAANQENKNRAYYQSNLIEQSSQKDRQVLISNPNSEKAATFYANTLEGIQGGVGLFWDKSQADQMVKNQAASYGQSYLEGALQNKRYNEVIRFADGKDPNGKVLLDQMDPTLLQKYKGEALRKMESEVEFSKVVLGKQLTDLKLGAFTGKTVRPEDVADVRQKLSLLKPEERAYAEDDLKMALDLGAKLNEAKSMKIQDIAKLRGTSVEVPDSTFNLSGRMQAQKMFEESLTNIINTKINKYPDFAVTEDHDFKLASKQALDISNPQAMANWATMVDSKQKQEGAPASKILTEEMSKTYSALLKAKNPEAISQVRNSLAEGFGQEYFGKVVSEMVANKHIDRNLALAMYMPDESSRKDMIATLSADQKVINSEYERVQDSSKASTLKSMWEDPEFKTLNQTIKNAPGAKWLGDALGESMEIAYKTAVSNGSTPKAAKEKAMEIAKSWGTASAGRSQVIIPREFHDSKSVIQDYMDQSVNDTDMMKHMDIKIPDIYLKDAKFMGDTEASKEKFFKDVKASGQWLSNASQSGAILAYKNKNDQLVPVRDSKGNIVERSFAEMKDNYYAAGSYNFKRGRF